MSRGIIREFVTTMHFEDTSDEALLRDARFEASSRVIRSMCRQRRRCGQISSTGFLTTLGHERAEEMLMCEFLLLYRRAGWM